MNKKILSTILLVASASISTLAIVTVGIFYSNTQSIKPVLPPDDNTVNPPDTKPPIVNPPDTTPPTVTPPDTKPPIVNPTPPPVTPPEDWTDINTTYFKEKVTPITNGSYSFSTPATGSDSIIPSNGPMKTIPSDGVKPNATVKTGKLLNDTDINSAKRSFSLVFQDGSGGRHLGTGWILDFKLTNDGSYPVTWYIATNAHVIQNLKVKNDVITPDRYNTSDGGDFYNTKSLTMFNILQKDDYKNITLGDTSDWSSFHSVEINPYTGGRQNLKTVFIGNDFLKTSPKLYSSSGRWANSEEYADFAVMEVTFSSSEEAKKMTHGYAENENVHFKYKKESLVKNQNNLNNNDFSVFGFPAITNQSPFNTTSIPTINRDIDAANNTGGKLGTSSFYQTFTNIKSAFDAALGLSYFGYSYRFFNPDRPDLPNDDRFYNSWGLMYPVDYGNLGPGSSGSMLLDKNGYTWGIHFAGDNNATTGLAQALYCEGFSYQGLFGRYNLEGYDLIDGGFPNQKNSYRDGLIKLYGNDPNFKTNLYKNGINR